MIIAGNYTPIPTGSDVQPYNFNRNTYNNYNQGQMTPNNFVTPQSNPMFLKPSLKKPY
jgi:hypothetical protein